MKLRIIIFKIYNFVSNYEKIVRKYGYGRRELKFFYFSIIEHLKHKLRQIEKRFFCLKKRQVVFFDWEREASIVSSRNERESTGWSIHSLPETLCLPEEYPRYEKRYARPESGSCSSS
jgi:hypothetical protein